jgi:hypothetical protein
MINLKNNSMKKFIIILLVIGVAGCADFLEEKQVSTLTQDYYKTESGLDALVKGLYVYARVKNEWEANGVRLLEPETDAYQTSAASAARYGAAEYASNVGTIAANNVTNYIGSANAGNAPMGAYPHINNCNIALDLITNSPPGKFGSDATYNATRKAEVLFLRAWAFYLVSNQLGDVPLLLTARREDNGIYYFPKSSIEDVYKRIIADVRFAYANLPPIQTDAGRITKWAAGHFLAKLYLNRAQAAGFQGNPEAHLRMLYKGNVATDLDSVISVSSEVITGVGGAGALATDYWSLFDPATSESAPAKEVLWSAQFDINTALNGRFGNRDVNYHIGDYTNQTGVTRVQAYGRPFGTFKPTDWGYDNFRDKVNDSRYYKTFAYEYIANIPNGTSTSFTWTTQSAAFWNANKPAGEPTVVAGAKRILQGKRALIYLENQKSEAIDSSLALSLPYQFAVRWVKSSKTGFFYYRLRPFDRADQGLITGNFAPYLSSRKFTDPSRGGSTAEANFNSEAGTRDFILIRLAETYLIRAEAYGRKGNYTSAVADINVLRNRAAYKGGEFRPSPLIEWEPQAATLTAAEKTAPFPAVNSYSKITVTENHFTPGTPQAIAEQYIPTISSKAEMFIHFIYNEKAREFLSELVAWEDQHNAGILYDRIVYFNQSASDKTGLWPVAKNQASGNGQNGNGKGLMKKAYTFRPWPNAYLTLLTDENGLPLAGEAMATYQNPGY